MADGNGSRPESDIPASGITADASAASIRLGPNLIGSPDWHELIGDLIKARESMPPLLRDNVAEVPTKSGGKYSYRYADLATILDLALEPLRKAGLTLVQAPDFDGTFMTLTTVIANQNGAWLSNVSRMPCGGRDPQAVGSAETYARRYALMALLALAGEDDDGAAAKPQTASNKEQAKKAANDATGGALKKGSDLPPPNEAKKKLLGIIKNEIKCPVARAAELFDAATGGQFMRPDMDDPEKAKKILALFEEQAKNLPYAKWVEEMDQLKLAAGAAAVDDFAKEALP